MGKVTSVKHVNMRKVAFSAIDASAVDTELSLWFDHAQRILNFRQTRDPYAIMVSEFMLQQTTVAVVEPYFSRFMKRFPSVQDLALASEDEVMQYWAGLGYYRRARQLRSAALEVVENMNGQFPRSACDLEKLPGFGRYTAGAVASLAYDFPAPILEANTIRVFARLAGLEGVIGDGAYMRQLWDISASLVEATESPRQFNLAAMELGALICRPKPRCVACPVQHRCIAYSKNLQEQIPRARPRPEKKTVHIICTVVQNGRGQYLVRRIPQGEWHSGLWEFPTFKRSDEGCDIKQVSQMLQTNFNVEACSVSSMTSLEYTVTHHKITCHVFHCHSEIEAGNVAFSGTETRLYPLEKIGELAMGSAQKKLLKILLKRAAEGVME